MSESPGHHEEQDAGNVEHYMGENGLAAEEEYKRGHYTCGEYDRTQSFPPKVPAAPHEFHATSILLDVLAKPQSLASRARDSPGVHLMSAALDRP